MLRIKVKKHFPPLSNVSRPHGRGHVGGGRFCRPGFTPRCAVFTAALTTARNGETCSMRVLHPAFLEQFGKLNLSKGLKTQLGPVASTQSSQGGILNEVSQFQHRPGEPNQSI